MKEKKSPETLSERRARLSGYRGVLRQVQAGKLELARLSARLLRLDPTEKGGQGVSCEEELCAVRARLSEDIARCRELLVELEEYIEGIEDYELRRIFTLRYIHAYSWRRIAFAIGGYEESYARKKHDLYIEKSIEKMTEKDLR